MPGKDPHDITSSLSVVSAATTLTGLHFAITGIVGAVSTALGYSSSKVAVPLWELAWFSIVANLSIVGMNLSLMLNSVGFYQVRQHSSSFCQASSACHVLDAKYMIFPAAALWLPMAWNYVDQETLP